MKKMIISIKIRDGAKRRKLQRNFRKQEGVTLPPILGRAAPASDIFFEKKMNGYLFTQKDSTANYWIEKSYISVLFLLAIS